MTYRMDRNALLAGATICTTAFAAGAEAQSGFRHRLRKALIAGKPTAENLKPIREAGFHGVETSAIVSPSEAAEARRIAEDLGLTIHSVLRGWAEFNSDDRDKAEQSFQVTADALRAAAAYGASAVLLVPCRIGGMPMPEPWEFRIRFHPETGHLTAVVEGDNSPYQAYMDAHNHAWDRSQDYIRRLIPIAQECGVIIAVENVWNNLFVDPHHLAAFVDSFASPWVQVYFDIGNHVKYGPPEQWIMVLGRRIVKCHVKDFLLNPDGHGGRFVEIRDGSVRWPAVRQALDDVGYADFMTIEGGKLPMEEQSRRLDLILAGQ